VRTRAPAAIAVTSIVLAGCGAASGVPRAAHRESHGSVEARTTLRPRSSRLASLPALGRLTGTCRHGAAHIAFEVSGGTSETVAVTSGRATRSAVLDPGERLASPASLRGVELWQISVISEGRIRVGTAWVSGHRLNGGPGCFVTARTDVTARTR
jgi:hypothetical protein